MTHARQQIRDAGQTLASGLPTTGANVFNTRLYELSPSQVPCWNVSTSEEPEELLEIEMGRAQQRVCRLTFAGLASAGKGQTVQELLDTMCEELEGAITQNALRALIDIMDIAYQSTQWNFDVEDTDAALAEVFVTYQVRYAVAEGDSGTLI